MSIKQKIWKHLDTHGSIYDQDIYDMGCDNYMTSYKYITSWKKLQSDRERFSGKKVDDFKHFRKGYYIHLEGDEDVFYKVSKDYWNEIYPQNASCL